MLNVVKSTPRNSELHQIQHVFQRLAEQRRGYRAQQVFHGESAEDLRSTNPALRDERELGFPQFLESFGLEKAASKKSWESEHPTKIVIRYW
jgi:PP-loop superfamily ATP-utilizing enzyme